MGAILSLVATLLGQLIPWLIKNQAAQEKARKTLKDFMEGKRNRANQTLETKANLDEQERELDEIVEKLKNPEKKA